jgi:alpha-glutamyl/putrescinyl thymine pyrophosphorylase clade 1
MLELATTIRSAVTALVLNIEMLLAWIVEREAIRHKKEAGERPPYSADPLFAAHFCNVRRSDDRTTKWIAEHICKPLADDLNAFLAVCIARLVNDTDTLARFDWSPPVTESLIEQFATIMRDGGRFSAAYVIPALQRLKGVPKADQIAEHVLPQLWAQREFLRPRADDTCRAFHQRLSRMPMCGGTGFIAGQIVRDLEFVEPLRSAADRDTWVTPGPGSFKGLNYICGRPRDAEWTDDEWLATFYQLREAVMPKLAEIGLGDLPATDLQNCLCELSKYLGAKFDGVKFKRPHYVPYAERKPPRSRSRPTATAASASAPASSVLLHLAEKRPPSRLATDDDGQSSTTSREAIMADEVKRPKLEVVSEEELDEEEREFRKLRRDLPGVKGSAAFGIVSIGVGKIPGVNEFFRTHETFRPVVPLVNHEVGLEKQYFAVDDAMVVALAGIGIRVSDHTLYLTVTPVGAVKIIPINCTSDNDYNRTKELGLLRGTREWVRLYTDQPNKAYKVFTAPVGRFADPIWPVLKPARIFRMAFRDKGRLVDSPDHPLFQKWAARDRK